MTKLGLSLLGLCASALVHAGAVPNSLQIERGAYLAKLGDCIACHSAPKGKPYSGGLPMQTPVGTIYSTNISPDRDTGIGKWTEREFDDALRRGVSRDGHNLYPAMPYPSYAKMRDEDVVALYAYFMKGVAPVSRQNRTSEIPFPMNMRWPLKLWNLSFLNRSVYSNSVAKSSDWNRGAYLTQGLGHCGSCHTPRGVAFQEKALDERGAEFLAGAELDGWFASNLTSARNVGLGRWSTQELQAFLRTGANRHASAFGPMTDVINNSTQFLNDADLRAMTTYLQSLAAQGGERRSAAADDPPPAATASSRVTSAVGARLYDQYCAHCHAVNGRGVSPWLAPLAGNPNSVAASATSLINVTLNGTADLVIQGIPAAYPMPPFAALLNDRELAEVLTFVRAAWGNDASAVLPGEVTKIRLKAH